MAMDLKKEFEALAQNEELMKEANATGSLEELYGVMSGHLPGVSYDEFNQLVLSYEDTSKLDDVDLEQVAGGAQGEKTLTIVNSITITTHGKAEAEQR